MDITIEKTAIADVDLIISLLKELYIELGEEEESIQFLSETLVASLIESGRTEAYFIRIEDQVVGIITITENQSIYAGGKYGLLDEMYIKPAWRSQGAGSACIAYLKEVAIKKEWKRIDVTAPTDEKWDKTIAFYKRCGFLYTDPKLKYTL